MEDHRGRELENRAVEEESGSPGGRREVWRWGFPWWSTADGANLQRSHDRPHHINPLTLLFSRPGPGPTHTLLTRCTALHCQCMCVCVCVCDLEFKGTHAAEHMHKMLIHAPAIRYTHTHTHTHTHCSFYSLLLCSLAAGSASFGLKSQQHQQNDSGAIVWRCVCVCVCVCMHSCRHACYTVSLASCCKWKHACYYLGCQVCSPPIRLPIQIATLRVLKVPYCRKWDLMFWLWSRSRCCINTVKISKHSTEKWTQPVFRDFKQAVGTSTWLWCHNYTVTALSHAPEHSERNNKNIPNCASFLSFASLPKPGANFTPNATQPPTV